MRLYDSTDPSIVEQGAVAFERRSTDYYCHCKSHRQNVSLFSHYGHESFFSACVGERRYGGHTLYNHVRTFFTLTRQCLLMSLRVQSIMISHFIINLGQADEASRGSDTIPGRIIGTMGQSLEFGMIVDQELALWETDTYSRDEMRSELEVESVEA